VKVRQAGRILTDSAELKHGARVTFLSEHQAMEWVRRRFDAIADNHPQRSAERVEELFKACRYSKEFAAS
jgi:hypothetical protein